MPGLKTIKTPIKPKKIAIHLRIPTFSSKINIAKIVIIIILAKLMEDTSASGRIPKALKKLNIAKQAITALNKCKLIFEVFKDALVTTTITKTGNKPKGFNFQGSPFGACFFDLFPFNNLFSPSSNIPSANGSLRYRDVFTGYVFTHPTKDQLFEPNDLWEF